MNGIKKFRILYSVNDESTCIIKLKSEIKENIFIEGVFIWFVLLNGKVCVPSQQPVHLSRWSQ